MTALLPFDIQHAGGRLVRSPYRWESPGHECLCTTHADSEHDSFTHTGAAAPEPQRKAVVEKSHLLPQELIFLKALLGLMEPTNQPRTLFKNITAPLRTGMAQLGHVSRSLGDTPQYARKTNTRPNPLPTTPSILVELKSSTD